MNSGKWHWKKLLRDWKTRMLLLAFLLFFSSFSLLYRQQTLELPVHEMENQYGVIQQLFHMIPAQHFEDGTGEEVYDLLAQQQRLYGMQRYILSEQEGNTVEGIGSVVDNYLNNGRKLTENQLRLWEMTDFQSHDLLTRTLSEPETLRQELAFYSFMEEQGLDIEWNPYSASQVLYQEVELMVGIVLFLFVALMASDRFTQDQTKNWSVTQGIPVSWKKQWHERSLQMWGLMWGVTLVGLAVSYGISLVRETPGSLQYPMAIQTAQNTSYIPLWQYILLLIGLGMLLSYVLLLLTTGLSWMIRNVYLTIGLSIGVYFIPYIWNIVEPLGSWQPSLYLHIVPVVSGVSAEQFGLPGIHVWKTPVMFLLYWLGLELVFNQVFDLIPTQTMGLKRRKRA
ncbi:hypothetical protein [Atopococcus tabaci]|uniref:hypothetical protein n=1 Tax=Atopococcus tabaci TaxID=269774 RepID=UPI002409C339|nr:hypothetical protein [Atopococcus tabaci]